MTITEKIDKYLGEKKNNFLPGRIINKVNSSLKNYFKNNEFKTIPMDGIRKILKNYDIFLPDSRETFNKNQDTVNMGLIYKTQSNGGGYITGRLQNKLIISYKKMKTGELSIDILVE